MKDKRPLIGITPGFDYSENRMFLNRGYSDAIILSGGMPVLVPITEDEKLLSEMIESFDGFLLSGGPDVDAVHWGEWNLRFNGEISPYRDSMELFIARQAIARDKPVLGICRGMHVMNIAMGGTIYQDIYSQIKDKELIKHSQNAPKWYPTHIVKAEKESIVYNAHNKDLICVNSFHHQAVRDAAPGFIVTARSEDGIIEAIEHTGCRFAVGVQWHPELMWERDPLFLELFKVFVDHTDK